MGRSVRAAVSAVFILLGAATALGQGLGLQAGGAGGESAHGQIGFVWDTAVATDRLFNYRMAVGWEWFEEHDEHSGLTEPVDGLLIQNHFGAGIHRSKAARVWVGPEVDVGFYGDEAPFGLGVGMAAGVNFHVNDQMSVGFVLGVRSMTYWEGLSDEDDTMGYLRLDLLGRTRADRYGEP